jgi:hypothetical protein
MTQKGGSKKPLRPGKKSGPASGARVERRKGASKKEASVTLPKEGKGAGGRKKGGGLH